MNSRWKFFLILILAVVLLHILIIKIFIIGSGDAAVVNNSSENIESLPEPPVPFKKK